MKRARPKRAGTTHRYLRDVQTPVRRDGWLSCCSSILSQSNQARGKTNQIEGDCLMPRFKFLAFTNPVEGREDEYNEWYTNTHLADLLRVPGLMSAQRFRLTGSQK